MTKKVIILNGSPRRNFNTAKLLKEAQRGAEAAGAQTEFINLYDLNFKGCMSCFACQRKGSTTEGVCAIRDDLKPVLEKCIDADAIIIGTPVYYYEMSGQMKTIIDRANSLYVTGYNFKDVYVITTSADTSEDTVQTVINGVNGWCACLPGVSIKGFINGGGLEAPNDASKHTELLQKAYELGKNI